MRRDPSLLVVARLARRVVSSPACTATPRIREIGHFVSRRVFGVRRTYPGWSLVSRTYCEELLLQRLTYTVTEVATLLGISRTTAYECVRRGEIRLFTIEGVVGV